MAVARDAITVQIGDAGERMQVQQAQSAVLDVVQATPLELAQCLVGVHQRQTQSIGDVLPGQWKENAKTRCIFTWLQSLDAFVEDDQKSRYTFLGIAAPDRAQRVVDDRLYLGGQPRNGETECRGGSVQFPQRVTMNDARRGIRQRLHPMR